MTPKKRKPEQPDAQIVQRHVLDVLAGMEAEAVSCVVTSPPYFSLRQYDVPDLVWGGKPKCKHRWTVHRGNPRGGSGPGAKETGNTYARGELRGSTCRCGAFRGQYGREPTRELYIEHSMMVLRALWRVLRKDGVIWWNLADGRSHRTLCQDLIPERFLLAAEAEGWLVCSKNIWHKVNCLPESVKRRPTDAYEYVFMLAKDPAYWYDSEAVREAPSAASMARISQPNFDQQTGGPRDYGKTGVNPSRSARKALENFAANPGRNMRSVWTFPTAQTREGTNYAVFPEELPRRCILASAPQAICSKCGVARVRVVEKTDEPDPSAKGSRFDVGITGAVNQKGRAQAGERFRSTTTGWTDCGCGTWACKRCGVVLDLECHDQPQRPIPGRARLSKLRRKVRGSVRRQAEASMQPGVSFASDSQDSPDDKGLHEDQAGLHLDPQAGSSESDEGRLCDGTSAGNGGGDRSSSAARRGRQSQERDQGRQSNRKPRSDDKAGARQAAQASTKAAAVSPLREDVSGHRRDAACPTCGSGLIFTHAPYTPGLVLDCFAGIGTTGVVAQRLGRRFVGIELSQKYCRMAAKRMEQTTLGIPL